MARMIPTIASANAVIPSHSFHFFLWWGHLNPAFYLWSIWRCVLVNLHLDYWHLKTWQEFLAAWLGLCAFYSCVLGFRELKSCSLCVLHACSVVFLTLRDSMDGIACQALPSMDFRAGILEWVAIFYSFAGLLYDPWRNDYEGVLFNKDWLCLLQMKCIDLTSARWAGDTTPPAENVHTFKKNHLFSPPSGESHGSSESIHKDSKLLNNEAVFPCIIIKDFFNIANLESWTLLKSRSFV